MVRLNNDEKLAGQTQLERHDLQGNLFSSSLELRTVYLSIYREQVRRLFVRTSLAASNVAPVRERSFLRRARVAEFLIRRVVPEQRDTGNNIVRNRVSSLPWLRHIYIHTHTRYTRRFIWICMQTRHVCRLARVLRTQSCHANAESKVDKRR